jgi:energy-coupling factor transporter ATP-binding protein EcfA2
MELVVLLPLHTRSRVSGCPLIRKTESDKYVAISDEENISAHFSSLDLETNRSILPGFIVNGIDYDSIITAMRTKLVQIGRYTLHDEIVGSPLFILKINQKEFIWIDSAMKQEILEKMDNIIDVDKQMTLFEAEVPLAVSPLLNLDETNPELMVIRVFFATDTDKDKFKYFDTFSSLGSFRGTLVDHAKETKAVVTVKVALPYDEFSECFSLPGSIEFILRLKKKYLTVIVRETPEKQAENPSAEILKYPAYKAAFFSNLKGKINSDRIRLTICIRDLNANIEEKKIYSPVISICQSSGSGKSKLACSLDGIFPCAYVVLRMNGEVAFPEQSRLGDLFLNCSIPLPIDTFDPALLNQTNIGRYSALFWAIAADYLSLVKELKEKNKLLDGIEIRRIILQKFIEGKVFGRELQKIESNQVLPIMSNSFEQFQDEIKILSCKICSELELDHVASPFVIIVDEANLLNNSEYNKGREKTPRSRLLRRAMHSLGTRSNVIFLTLGTNTDYMDLNPVVSSDSIRDAGRFNLYPPFILSRNTDIYNAEIAKKRVTVKTLKDPRFILLRFAMGRPLWQSLGLSQVVPMARIKLENSSVESGQVFIACWMIRTGIAANPRMVDASRHMVKSNMATLLNIHPTFPVMSICYPSEPALAMASQIIVSSDILRYFTMLRNHLISAGFDRGDLAETLTAEICIQAMHKAEPIKLEAAGTCEDLNDLQFINSEKFLLESQLDPETLKEKSDQYNVPNHSIELAYANYLHHTTVEGFLKALYKDQYEKMDLNIDPKILRGLISFNHFIRLNHAPPMNDFRTGAADDKWEKNG